MFNQIRAEFYKLFHTKALYLTFALILAVFGIFSIGGQQQFVVSSSSLDGTWKIGETVGFLARAYSDTAHPMIEEIIRTATSYTVFFWLIVLIFSVIFFSREYTDSTIKIAIASGQSRIKFFVAKYIVITITSIFLYFSFIMIAFIIECAKFNVPIQLFPMLKIAGLNCMVMGAFIGITLMLCVIFKHTAIVVGAMSLFTFSGPLMLIDKIAEEHRHKSRYSTGEAIGRASKSRGRATTCAANDKTVTNISSDCTSHQEKDTAGSTHGKIPVKGGRIAAAIPPDAEHRYKINRNNNDDRSQHSDFLSFLHHAEAQ